MSSRRLTASLVLALAVAAVPAWAATPAPQADPINPAALLDAIFAPATSVPASTLTNPYLGFCSQTCRPCSSSAPQPCPPDPDTGSSQFCARTRIC